MSIVPLGATNVAGKKYTFPLKILAGAIGLYRQEDTMHTFVEVHALESLVSLKWTLITAQYLR